MEDYGKKQQRAQRHELKYRRLGTPDPHCANCRMSAVESLMPVAASSLPKGFLEQHHLGGRAASNLTITLCRNCHAVLTDRQEDWDRRLRHPSTSTERFAAFLQGLADWFRALAQSLSDVAACIEAYVRWLLDGMKGPGPAYGGAS